MANSLNTNPIVLDTFTSDIDIGNSLYGDSNTTFFINSIEWASPSGVTDFYLMTQDWQQLLTEDSESLLTQITNDVANITNANGDYIFNETCVIPNQSVIKYFFGQPVYGIVIASGEVSSGRIIIHLR